MLAAIALFIPTCRRARRRVTLMSAIAILSGTESPSYTEGLRALHGLDAISASLSRQFSWWLDSWVAGGALLSATLPRCRLKAEMCLLAAPVSAAALWLSGLVLPLDTKQSAAGHRRHMTTSPFDPLHRYFIMVRYSLPARKYKPHCYIISAR